METGDRATTKRVATLMISAFFLALNWLWEMVLRHVGQNDRATGVILYYHEVRSEYRLQFARQMDILLRRAMPVRADHKIQLSAKGRYVAVTFDDGYLNVLENALPELEKRRIPSTLFIVTDVLGKSPLWMMNSSSAEVGRSIISEDQLRELSSDLITIGSHTMTHPDLSLLEEEDARRELSGSKAKLEEILNKEIRLFSFPHGAFNAKLVEWCRDSGYERVFSILPTLAFSNPQEFVSGRVSVEPTDWPLEFRLKLLGAYRWLPLAFAFKRRIRAIFAEHAGEFRGAPFVAGGDANQ